jgi:UDP-glucose 4-epimerase
VTILITGVAGFVGCNLAQAFLKQGETVAGFDNLSRGRLQNLAIVSTAQRFSFVQVDLAEIEDYGRALRHVHDRNPVSEIWHLAANSDIPAGTADPAVDMRDTFLTTFNTLRLMKELKIPTLAFSSSSAVYGDHGDGMLNEVSGPLLPISNYGAMKLASEACISAAVEEFLTHAHIFRFPNVLGVPATHGVILDFVRRLRTTPDCLTVLGNGNQQKSYLHIDDLIEAMLFIRQRASDRRSVFNIAADDAGVTVRFIAEEVLGVVAPGARIVYGKEDRGWVGDVPRFRYSIAKLRALGWQPRMDSVEAVRKAVSEIANQELSK